MIRTVIVLLLLLSAAVMMRGLAGDWRENLSSFGQETARKVAPAGEETAVAPIPQAKALQPSVPAALPDLKTGYLFNQERTLADVVDIVPESDGEGADNENTSGITASIDEVTYTGSIITDAFSRAIIVYPAAAKKTGRPPAAPRSTRGMMPVAAAGPEEHARLAVGDVLDGYEVKEILADKLIFTKGEEVVEKLLFDPGKKRLEPPPAPAPQAGGLPSRPQQMTIGAGAVAPTEPQEAGGGPPPPGRVNIPPASPPPPAQPPEVNNPPNPGAARTSPTRPVRRMVISRQPSPGLQDPGGEEEEQ